MARITALWREGEENENGWTTEFVVIIIMMEMSRK